MAPPRGPSFWLGSLGWGENIGVVVQIPLAIDSLGHSRKHSATTMRLKDNQDYSNVTASVPNQRRALGILTTIVRASGGNHRVSRVAWDEEGRR